MRNKTLVFTATYNEAGNIEKFLDVALKFKDIDILIIDDNSPDKTWQIIKNFQKNKSNLYLIKRSGKEGLDTAHKNAFQFAKEKGYKNLITMDADLSHDPDLIPRFMIELENKAFVIGSRYMKGGKNHMSFGRYILSYVGNKVIKFVLNIDCEEFTTSYRGFNLMELKNFDINNVNSKGYSFFMETIFQINKLGFKIFQLPIHFKIRKIGKSKIPSIEIFRTLKNLFILKIKG